MKMKLAHKIIVGFAVLTLLSGVFSSYVFYAQASKLEAEAQGGSQVLQDYAQGAKRLALTIGLFSIVLGSLIGFVLVKQIVTPIQAIGIALSAYVKDGKKSKIVIPNKDEIGALALYINEIISKK